MRRIFIISFLTGVLSSQLFACGCHDTGQAPLRAKTTLQKYYQQDSEIAQEINKMTDDIKEAHRKFEFESGLRIEDTKRLLAKQLELQKEIVFNSVAISKIEAIINSKKATENILNMEK